MAKESVLLGIISDQAKQHNAIYLELIKLREIRDALREWGKEISATLPEWDKAHWAARALVRALELAREGEHETKD